MLNRYEIIINYVELFSGFTPELLFRVPGMRQKSLWHCLSKRMFYVYEKQKQKYINIKAYNINLFRKHDQISKVL